MAKSEAIAHSSPIHPTSSEMFLKLSFKNSAKLSVILESLSFCCLFISVPAALKAAHRVVIEELASEKVLACMANRYFLLWRVGRLRQKKGAVKSTAWGAVIITTPKRVRGSPFQPTSRGDATYYLLSDHNPRPLFYFYTSHLRQPKHRKE